MAKAHRSIWACGCSVVYTLSQCRWVFNPFHCTPIHCFLFAKPCQLSGSMVCVVDGGTQASQYTGIDFANFEWHSYLTVWQADKWDPEQLYRDIMVINYQHSDKLCLASTSPASRITGSTPLNPRLSCIIEETFKVRASGQMMRGLSRGQLQVYLAAGSVYLFQFLQFFS